MIDIHCHILPQVDDGAKSLEDAMTMAQIALEEGITHIVATPHYIEDENYLPKVEINKKVSQLNDLFKENDISLEVLPGNEVFITPNILPIIKKGYVNTINDTGYLLLEFPMLDIPNYVEEVIYNLKLIGITPIIAHPERYKHVLENPNILLKYIDLGGLCQANSGSITGKFGKKVMEITEKLIEHNFIHLVGSDAHSPRSRAPKLKRAYDKVKSMYGENKADTLFKINPSKIIKGETIDIEQPLQIKTEVGLKKVIKILKYYIRKTS